ncbi:mucin-2-like [Drosophila ananassae]|uniref:mucin-2 n=1 Tax=Drosophila ananassae TaxID=7217 RepID=UPI0013A5D806|nr:mucin-2 [Drosophila ananassae]XP_032308794.1 mucin-2-like [Drosophila ananassae]XP_032308802.1 mucin-2-like [Drosophila ananassae]
MLFQSSKWALFSWLIVLAQHGGQADILDPVCPSGYRYIDGMCHSSCPSGQYLHTNGNCYPQTSLKCLDGYFLNTDGQCYRTNPLPCPFETTTTTTEPTTTTTEPTTTTTTTEPTTTTTTTTTEPTTTTTTTELPVLPPSEIVQCPPGSILYERECRKIVCAEGENYQGRCISPVCPPGTVWRGGRCQEPGYLTTILEIDNVIHNQHEYNVVTENINRVDYVTQPPYQPDEDNSIEYPPENIVKSTTTSRPWVYPSIVTTTEKSSSGEAFPGRIPPPGCCLVMSPRVCIDYTPNWVCSSRPLKLCDPRVCQTPWVYLKPPTTVQSTKNGRKMVVMPPNPPIRGCSTPECKESEILDCSGCNDNVLEKCSRGCYNYYCPSGTCGFMNSETYCGYYPGGFGCNEDDGCIWDWCKEKCY